MFESRPARADSTCANGDRSQPIQKQVVGDPTPPRLVFFYYSPKTRPELSSFAQGFTFSALWAWWTASGSTLHVILAAIHGTARLIWTRCLSNGVRHLSLRISPA